MSWRSLFSLLILTFISAESSARVDEEGNYELEPLFKNKDWDMSAELGMLISSGNTESTSLLGRITASHDWQSWRFNYDLNTLVKRDEKYDEELQRERLKTTAERYQLQVQGEYKLTETDAIFSRYELTDDRFASYTEYVAAVIGYSFRAIENHNMELDLTLGPGYARGLTSDDILEKGMVVRASASYKWDISDNAQFRQIISVQGAEFNNRSISETSLSTKITGSMQMKVSFKAVHNSKVEDDKEKLDTETSLTLVVNI